MKIEKAIAEISYGREDLRDSQKNYNKLAYEDFKQIESPLDWDVYFESMGLAGLKELDAKQINFYKDMSEALRNTTVDEQKYYLAFNLLSAAAPYLSDDFVDADFEFYGKVMSGKQEQQPVSYTHLDVYKRQYDIHAFYHFAVNRVLIVEERYATFVLVSLTEFRV